MELYILATDVQHPERFLVHRADKSDAGYLRHEGDDWVVEDSPEEHPIVFKAVESAALFLCMRGRAFRCFVDTGDESIEVRVVPNFGQRWSCRIGQWVATLQVGNRAVGSDCCAETLRDAKLRGIKKAYLHKVPLEYELMPIVEADWPVIVLE